MPTSSWHQWEPPSTDRQNISSDATLLPQQTSCESDPIVGKYGDIPNASWLLKISCDRHNAIAYSGVRQPAQPSKRTRVKTEVSDQKGNHVWCTRRHRQHKRAAHCIARHQRMTAPSDARSHCIASQGHCRSQSYLHGQRCAQARHQPELQSHRQNPNRLVMGSNSPFTGLNGGLRSQGSPEQRERTEGGQTTLN